MKKLVLIDAMALLYRSFYAIRELSTDAGRPTNAVYGFIRKIHALERTLEPTHWAVVFDGGLPQRRLQLLEDYKAQRPPMPPGLREQLPTAEDYLTAARIPHLRLEEEEADDVMASMVDWAEPEADQVDLVSSDKDLFQLVSTTTRVIPLSGNVDVLDREAVRTKTGVEPSQIVDWLALVGDTVDNIRGLPGVGPKTAATLLHTYGSLTEIRDRIDDLPPGKLRDNLQANWDLIDRNRELVRLHTDVGRDWDWNEFRVHPPDEARLLALYEELEFKNLARDIREPKLL